MNAASQVIAGAVAALHVYFLVLEMFLWTTPFGAKTFARPLAEQQQSKVLAANQGLYNGFLAAGLVWSLVASEPIAYQVRLFFLACVVIAGLYGAATASKKILFVQAIPAAAGLAITWLAYH
jgi:putative membrane protein